MMRLLVLLAIAGLFGFLALHFGREVALYLQMPPPGKHASDAASNLAPGAPTIKSGTQKQLAALAPLAPAATYDVIVQRPIFFHNRAFPKPPPKKKVVRPKPTPRPRVVKRLPAPKPPPPPPKFVGELHGVVLTGPVRKALISSKGSGAKWFSEGQTVDGWSVVSIAATAVELRLKGVRAHVKLFAPPSSR